MSITRVVKISRSAVLVRSRFLSFTVCSPVVQDLIELSVCLRWERRREMFSPKHGASCVGEGPDLVQRGVELRYGPEPRQAHEFIAPFSMRFLYVTCE